MQDPESIAAWVAGGGFVLAAVFGWVSSRTHFCTMGAISDAMNIGDWSRLRMWALAVAVAIVLTNSMVLAGWIDLSKALYTGPRLSWLSHLLGGFLFGVGMTIASGCGARNLVRLGAGNLKSLVVLLCLGLSAYMTMKGAFAPFRVSVLERFSLEFDNGQTLVELLGALFDGSDHDVLRAGMTLLLAILLGGFALTQPAFRRQRSYVWGGACIGLLVAAGWYVTGHFGYLAEDPNTLQEAYLGSSTRRPESFTFVGPVAYGLELLLLWTDASLRVTFGIAAVAGMVAGALGYAIAYRQFRWEGFASPADLRNHILGGVLMGFGGVCALGCTIGQGITGVSTLALGSFLTLAALIAGCVCTMKWMYWRLERQDT